VSRRGILVRPDAASSRGRETDRDIALSED
jgi:hypothetical protein